MKPNYETLFHAFREAGEAYAKLQSRRTATDAELARDPDYRRLHRCGMTIAITGGGAALSGAIEALAARASEAAKAQAELQRYWAGMERW